jgi:hypothetical protein
MVVTGMRVESCDFWSQFVGQVVYNHFQSSILGKALLLPQPLKLQMHKSPQ